MSKFLIAATTALLLASASAQAQTVNAADEIAKYRAMLADGNPAELTQLQGEGLWKIRSGPKNVSLERCDLGLGAGVLKGAYAQLPRYFADANRVMDLETRLVHCMVTLQGKPLDEILKKPFSEQGERQTDLEALVAYIVDESRGMKIAVAQAHPMEKASYARGEKAFFYRAGPFDFNCASCHGSENNVSACKIYLTWRAMLWPRKKPLRAGPPIALARARCAPCSGVCMTVFGSSVFLS
jgi:sulfur-oxidizing protein SoxA